MEYLQYNTGPACFLLFLGSFKPYYKWNTFNTIDGTEYDISGSEF